MKNLSILAILLSLALNTHNNAFAEINVGNVTVAGAGTCAIPKNSSNIFVTYFQQTINGVPNTVYRINILNNVQGFAQPQYIVDTIY